LELGRYENRHRRLVLERFAVLDPSTGSVDEQVPFGSYVLRFWGPGGEVRLPAYVERGARVRLAGPRLPEAGELGPDDVLVPASWCRLGGDPSAIGSGPARETWLDAFVIRRYPVTNAEYLRFLNDLVAQGDEGQARVAVPREKGGTVGEGGAIIFGRHADGRFYLRPDADGDIWEPDHPVVHVSWWGAAAFAAWEAKRTGQPWRLPTADEREKAGRGADGRFFPWGDHLDPSFCCMRDSHRDRALFASIHDFPIDESPYGVRGLSGNVRDWCLDEPSPGRRTNRGGFWLCNAREARLADQHDHVPEHRGAEIGLRLARSFL
jgi:serine/threonine-protein kinase